MAVMQALLEPGDTFMGLDLSHGGHLSHGSPVNASGMLYKPVAYHVAKETGRVDYDEMEKIALECKPKLIIAGASAYSRDWDYKRMRAIADKVGAVLMADVSHPAGLIAKGLLNDPLEYCHIITTTTHKTLRGPRGGMIPFSLLTLTPLAWVILRASPFEGKICVLTAMKSTIGMPASRSVRETCSCGTPSKTSKKVCSSSFSKPSRGRIPNRPLLS